MSQLDLGCSDENRHKLELTLVDLVKNKKGELVERKRTKTFKNGNDMYHYSSLERPKWKYEQKHEKQGKRKNNEKA